MADPRDRHTDAVAGTFADLVERGRLELPLPARGNTVARWWALAGLAAEDLNVARLAEAHLDALAILDELGAPAPGSRPAGARWAVWAAEPPNGRVSACSTGATGWELTGVKRWCSGAHVCTHALITAHTEDTSMLFAVDLAQDGVRPGRGGWKGMGMAGSGTEDVELVAVSATPVGGPRAYLDRAGFWHGAIGVAACWFGGAVAVGRPLWTAARRGGLDPHARAHLGAIDAALAAAGAVLRAAASDLDRDGAPVSSDPDRIAVARRQALQVRAVVEHTAAVTVDRVGRALGPRPLAGDAEHSRRVADLGVYVRQSHAERDLAALGDLAAASERWLLW